jgi:putative flavoprotein involved in K+ transport
MSSWQRPRVPDLASELDRRIVQLHAAEYKNPRQLQEGDVLVVGAGNSGAEIAIEVARTHKVMLAGPSTGAIPFRPESVVARALMPIIGRIVFHRVLTIRTPIGKKARPKMISSGEPLIRVKPKDLKAAGVERVPRVTDVQDGSPQLEDGRTVEVASVVWCTGFHPGFSWIDLPVLGPQEPLHKRGVVGSEPGLYFIGLKFLYSVSSEQIQGIGRDADYIAKKIAAGRRVRRAGRSVGDRQRSDTRWRDPQEREARNSTTTRSARAPGRIRACAPRSGGECSIP